MLPPPAQTRSRWISRRWKPCAACIPAADCCSRTTHRSSLRSIPQAAFAAKLDDALFAVREIQGPDAFPRPAAEYLDDWAGEGKAWLRKFYPPGVDEPAY